MGQCNLKALLMLCIILFLFITSCTHQEKVEVDQIQAQSRQHINTGDFQKAMDTYRINHSKYPEDQALTRSYIRTVEDIKNTADKAFNSENFAPAGKTYRILLRNHTHFKDFAQKLSFDRKFLNTRISECSSNLFKKGLEEYRSGNLNNAISLWEGLLSFDPNNAEARKALNTAVTQQKTLQQKK